MLAFTYFSVPLNLINWILSRIRKTWWMIVMTPVMKRLQRYLHLLFEWSKHVIRLVLIRFLYKRLNSPRKGHLLCWKLPSPTKRQNWLLLLVKQVAISFYILFEISTWFGCPNKDSKLIKCLCAGNKSVHTATPYPSKKAGKGNKTK